MVDQYSIMFNWAILPIILLIGFVLVAVRPWAAFLCGIFISMALNMSTLSGTRIEEIGPFFTFYDACLVICFLAYIYDKNRSFSLPKPAQIIIAVLTMGTINSLAQLGFNMSVMRAARYGMDIPLFFIIAAGLVRDESRVRSLLWTILAAAVAAEIQHLFVILVIRQTSADPELMRSVRFGLGGSDAWLLAGSYLVAGKIVHPLIQAGIGTLFLVTNLSTQTRSLALGFLGGLGVYYGWFLTGSQSFRWQRIKLVLGVGIIGLLFLSLTGLSEISENFVDRFITTFSHQKQQFTGMETREETFKTEINDWLNGNVVIGRGLYYYDIHRRERIADSSGNRPAWGHLGYVAYLSQLGIIGLIVYGIYFPLGVLFRARKIMRRADLPPSVSHLAALTGALFISQPIIFIFSNSFLGKAILPGLLAGAVWAIVNNVDNFKIMDIDEEDIGGLVNIQGSKVSL